MTLRRRRLWLVAIVGLILAGGVSILWDLAVGTSLTTKDVGRIKLGMTKIQVYEALGQAKHDGPVIFIGNDRKMIDWESDQWSVSDGVIQIWFDRRGVVVHRDSQSFGLAEWQWQRLCFRLGI